MTDNSQYSKQVKISEIKEFFQLEQVTGNEESLKRWVVIPDVYRPGFELCGYFQPTDPRRIIIIGKKEIEFISNLSEADQRERFQPITDGLTPMIIVTHYNEVPPILKEVASAKNFPIFRSPSATYRFVVDLITYLDEKLAPEETVSGDLVVVYGKGVLLMGESGQGKSETALELIKDGQVLVSDDRVDLQKIHNQLVGHAPDILRGMLEIRGIGIIDVERMFGANKIANDADVDIVIKLVPFSQNEEYERIGDEMTGSITIMGIKVPMMEIPVSPGRSTKDLVETAVTNYILKEEGYNSTATFKKRLYTMLEKENRENKK